MMEGAKVSKEDWWKKSIAYTKAIFSRIYDVCTVSFNRTIGAIINGILFAMDLLEAFTTIGWIRHLDILTALVVASLQKEGGTIKDTIKQLKDITTAVGKNTKGLKYLKTIHPNLSM